MATFRLYKTSVSGGNDISSYIYELSPFSYRINDDFGFELPELSFSSTQELAEGTKVLICDTASIYVKQVCFYVKKAEWNQDKLMYDYTCPHILEQLSYIKVKDLPVGTFGDWSDITPGYDLYNNQTDYSSQGQFIWGRKYYQALFLLKMMVRKVTGLGIAAIDSTAVDDKDSPYYSRIDAYPAQGYTDTPITYARIGLNISCTLRMGTADHTEVLATDFWTLNELPNCLQLLRMICSALKLTIDIFRMDYKIEILAVSGAPTAAATLGFSNPNLERYRKFAASFGRLHGGSFDYIFGEWDGGETYTAYTYGVDGAVRDIMEWKAECEDTGVDTTRALSAKFTDFFRVYGISGTNYQANVYQIYDEELDSYEETQYVAALKAFWEQYEAREKYEIALPGLELRLPYVEIDIAANRLHYERLV